jgi:hypothetical protein
MINVRRNPLVFWSLPIALLLSQSMVSSLKSQEIDGTPSADQVWRLRRILVPESELDAVVRGRYLPLDFARFQSLIDLNRQRTNVVNQWPIDRVCLEGRLQPGGECVGTGFAQVAPAIGNEPWLTLDPPNFFAGGFSWHELDGSNARVGIGKGDRWSIENVGAHHLGFDWAMLPSGNGSESSRGTTVFGTSKSRDSTWIYTLDLPGVALVSLHLQVPEDWELSFDEGVCRRLAVAPEPESVGLASWQIEFSKPGPHRLVVRQAEDLKLIQSPLSFQSDSAFQVGVGRVASRTTFRWEDTGLEFLPLVIPPDWTVISVKSEGNDLPFQLNEKGDDADVWVAVSAGSQAVTEINVELERRYDFSERLRLEPPQLEGTWTRGTLSVEVSPLLQVMDWQLFDARWSSLTTGGDGTNQLQAECFSDRSSLRLQVDASPGILQGTAYTQVVAEGQKLSAVVHLWGSSAAVTSLEWRYPLSPGWIVDQVTLQTDEEEESDELLESWDIVQSDSGALVDVHLKQALPTETQVHLQIEAHLLAFPSPVDRLNLETLGVVDLKNQTEWEHWLDVQAEPPHRFIWLGSEGMAIKPLPTNEQLLELQSSGPSQRLQLIEKGENRDFFQIQNEPSEQFETDYEVRCDIDDRTVSQQIRIHCRPLDSRLSRIQLHWPDIKLGTWTWRLERSGGLPSTPLVAIEDFDVEADQASTLLEWNDRLDQPFTLIGESSQAWVEPWSPQIPVVARAQRVTGTVTLVSRARQNLQLQIDRLGQLPNSIAGTGDEGKLIGVFDLAEALAQQSGMTERLALQSVEGSTMRPVIWNAWLESWPGAVMTRHRLTFDVEVSGPANLTLFPMQGCILKSVNVNRRSVVASDVELTTSATRQWDIPIESVPVRQRVALEFTSRERLGRIFETLTHPLPKSDAVWMKTDWLVHLPSGYQTLEQQSTPGEEGWLAWAGWLVWRWTGLDPGLDGASSELVASRAGIGAAAETKFSEEAIWIEEGISPATRLPLQRVGVGGGVFSLMTFGFAFALLALLGRRSVAYGVFAIVGMIGVLWCPLEWHVWTRAILPGCVLAFAIHAIRKPATNTYVASDEGPQSHLSRVPVLASILLWSGVLLLSGMAGHVRGAIQEQDDSADSARWVDVIIPVDTDGQPSQDLVYLPKFFKDQLLKTAPRSDLETPWIMESAQHVIDIENNSLSDVSRWKLSSRFKIRTLKPKALFTLPFSAGQVLVQADQVQLNQSVISVSGTPQSGLSIEIESPGIHDLVVPGVLLSPNNNDQPFVWTPPQIPDSEFRLNGLAGSGWNLENTLPWVETLDLGTDRLRLRGITPAIRFQPRLTPKPDQESLPELGVAEIVFREGDDLFVTLWFRPDAANRLPDSMSFSVGPGWEVQGNSFPAASEFRLSRQGDESICELVLPAERTIPLAAVQLKLSETLKAGQWKLPTLKSNSFVVSSRQLILKPSVEAQWSYSRPGNPLASQILEDLGSLWSTDQLELMGVAQSETMAIDLPAKFADEFLEVGPDSAVLSADHQIEIDVDWSETTFQGSALVSVMRGEVGSVEIEGNQPFSLTGVELTLDGVALPFAQVRLSPSRFLIMFDERIRSVFNLSFSGVIPRSQSEGPIPVIQIDGIQDVTYRCKLRRSPLAQTRLWPLDQEVISGFGPPADFGTSSKSTVPDLELSDLDLDLKNQRQTEFQVDGDQLTQVKTNWRIVVERTRQPKIGEVLAKYERETTAWRLTLFVRVAESEPWGLELLDLDVPEEFIAINRDEQGEWVEDGGALLNHQRRWVASRRILPGEWVALEGTIPRFPNGPFQPRLINHLPETYRVALPKAQQDDTFLWQHNSTEVSEFSDVEAGRLDTSQEWMVLQRETLGEGVRLASKPLAVRPTRVHLADYRAFWREDGISMTCRFVVDPGGQSSLPVHIPTEFQLMAIKVDGRLQNFPAEGLNTIQLAHRELPQEVTLWCHAPWEVGSFQAIKQQVLPWLAMPAEVTLLAVRERPNSRQPIEVGGVGRITHSSWEEAVRAANQKVMQVTSTNTQLSPEAMKKWMGFWTQRSLASRAEDEAFVNDLGRRVEIGDAGDLIWQLTSDGESSRVGGKRPDEFQPEMAGWRYYQPLGQDSSFKLSIGQSPSINRADLGGVTAALVVVLAIGGWGISRLSRLWRLVGMLVVTMVGAAWLSVIHGPLWIGGVVVIACLFGLLKLILKPRPNSSLRVS